MITKARVLKAGKSKFVSSRNVEDNKSNILATGEVMRRYSLSSHLLDGMSEGLNAAKP